MDTCGKCGTELLDQTCVDCGKALCPRCDKDSIEVGLCIDCEEAWEAEEDLGE